MASGRHEFGVQHDDSVSVQHDGHAFQSEQSAQDSVNEYNAADECSECISEAKFHHYLIFRTVMTSDWKRPNPPR